MIRFRLARDKAVQSNAYRWYSPRFWHGMRCGDWFRMLRRNRFSISPTRWGLAGTVSLLTLFNSVGAWLQHLVLGRKIEATQLVDSPIFVIGHWRSGTTLLHELLVLDDHFTYPDTYACFAPNHFVISRPFMVPWLRYLLPTRRPMDDVRLGWDRPQEDEFALMNMGLLSPYESLAFPNRVRPGLAYLDHENWHPDERHRWKERLVWFLKCVTYNDPRPVVLKSPPHTARVGMLREEFPQARFVHIVRHPYALFASTVRLWKSLSLVQGLQVPKDKEIEESVLAGLESMYDQFAEQKSLLPSSQYVEVRYEQLVADPRPVLQSVYRQLELGGFDEYLPKLERYWSAMADYPTRNYSLPPETRREIGQRWKRYFHDYGYSAEPEGNEP